MQTNLADFLQGTKDGERAKEIIGACVHCGFCSATCPTYQVLGDELDGPRGRIYLMKQVLEGTPATASTQLHLDRCLTCRSCETTCPSGVEYSHLLDIGRNVVEQQVPRPLGQQWLRKSLLKVLPRPLLATPLLKIGKALRPVLPERLRQKMPVFAKPAYLKAVRDMGKFDGDGWPARAQSRRMLILDGCVQPGMAPNINAAAARVFDALGVQLVRAPKAGCCGALRHHLNEQEAALADMRRNIDAWWPYIDGAQGVEAILMTASGCGVTVREYGYLLAHDADYAHKAARIALLTSDISELLPPFLPALQALVQGNAAKKAAAGLAVPATRVAYHPPCTLQHGQQLRGQVESLLRALNVEVKLPQDSHLCCGSAGTYSIFQPELANSLRDNKLRNLAACLGHGGGHEANGKGAGASGACIVSGNIGCLTHLQCGTETPVRHWIELVDDLIW